MNKKLFIITSLLVIVGFVQQAKGQSEVTIQNCTKHLKAPFVSDGQQYKALLTGKEVAEFHTTFYSENLYRIVGATGKEEGNVIFSVYDQENHLLFTNKDHHNSPYWDFKFQNTMNCTIEAHLNNNEITSGLVLILIGFKQ